MEIVVCLPLLVVVVPAALWLAPRCHPRTANWGLLTTVIVAATGGTVLLGLLTAAGLAGAMAP
ncbi:hypothetical protein [Umezawaea sp. Da 62-37]|uniref:hypothetical protein n=1 Tax=Umezawaea sp. Da 62-37 TaxID=3075927 RepID=UPI0028F74445|nr:hypothetical protein [Umezawaea sp. Da 62-37]WNV83002.1 hypothetical protein RM788_33070 [Umezawaea sp. Da 62-37]